MQQHVKSMQSVTPPHSPPPNRSYQGVKPTIGSDTYSMDHLRKWKEEAKVAPVGHQSYQGVKPQIDQDNFLYSEMKRSRENMLQSERFAAKSLKPHVGNDAKMFDHAKAMKVQQQQPPTESRRSPFMGVATKVGPDSFNMRVTKAQMPPTSRTMYRGVKPAMDGDSFQLNFFKSMTKAWGSSAKSRSQEVRL